MGGMVRRSGGPARRVRLVLDISMPTITRPLRRLIIRSFDKENLRAMAAVKKYAEAHAK